MKCIIKEQGTETQDEIKRRVEDIRGELTDESDRASAVEEAVWQMIFETELPIRVTGVWIFWRGANVCDVDNGTFHVRTERGGQIVEVATIAANLVTDLDGFDIYCDEPDEDGLCSGEWTNATIERS